MWEILDKVETRFEDQEEGYIIETTSALQVHTGCFVRVSVTRSPGPGAPPIIAEAVAFAPNTNIAQLRGS